MTLVRIATAVLVAVTLVSCQRSGSGEAAGFGGTGKAETPFTSTGQAVEVSLTVSLEVGTAELKVLDPAGAVRFEKRVDPTTPVNVRLPLTGPPGQWVVVLSYVDAQGSRSVEWHQG
jgi:hypothetical protein